MVFAAMEFGQVLVEHHLPFADDVDPLLNRRSGGSPEAFIRFLLVTLVLSVHSRNYLWLVVDRRLSYGARRPPVDDAVKVMNLETTDGVGLLAYAGLGATSSGTQPSDWMSAVLRGRGGLTFEQALGVLSTAATKQLPKHLAQLPYGAHFIIIPAFVRGVGSRLYSIDNVVDPKGQRHWYRYTSHQRTVEPGSPSVRLAVGGTGGLYLAKNRSWQRSLLSLVNAHDRGKVSDHVVADRLARLNYEAHQVVRDASVGPRCIVVWRRRPDAQPGAPGGGHQFYTGVDRDLDSASIPAIANGMDVHAIIGVVMKDFQARTASHGFSFAAASDFDKDEMTRLLAELPSEPDERLR
ncbi:MAG TPA: hypothetical protein VLK37_13690 [Solirubrobacterales bacterium]|nr:hypothetical protein [Solirubrobacterales bacterium]